MPTRIFAITAARETVTLDNQGRAEASFTASNTGPKLMAGRAKLVAIGSTKEGWLSLDGQPERKFAKGEAHQFTVKVAAPPGTPVGKYTFRLDIISVENPDDEFTEGPSVSFEVKELAVAKPPPRKFPWWIVAVAGVLVLGAGLIIWLLIPQKTTVPDMVGMPYKEAIKTLEAAKLKLTANDQRVITGKVPIGAIANQSPAADQRVPVGTKVTLTAEAESVQVPRLIDRSPSEVGPMLKDARLQLRTEAKSAGAKAGTIVDQNPKPDERVAPDTMITAFVEPGPEMVTVPDVIGVPVDKVAPMFQRKLAYQVNDQRVITGKVPIGAIANQSPAADQSVPVGTKVTLTAEAESVQVPRLIDRSPGEIGPMLKEARLQLTTQYMGSAGVKQGTIWNQIPNPNVRVAPGTMITVYVQPEPEMVTVPDVIGVPVAEVEPKFQRKLLLRINTEQVYTGKVPVGAVANQSPAAGDRVPVHTTITVNVEAYSVVVPNLIGKTVEQAKRELEPTYLGFDCRTSAVSSLERGPMIQGTPVGWIVTSQSLEAGTRVSAPGTVTVKLGVRAP
jgi:beta-lactam-binding protein with PASTA domain